MRTSVYIVLSIMLIAALCGCGAKRGTLTFTVVPYEAAEKLNEEYAPMATYLAQKTGMKQGKFMPVIDYSGVVAALKAGQVDVAYLSPFPYVLATGEMKLQPLAMPWVMGNLSYRGIIFVKADSPIKSLQDLKGHTFAFGDLASTSGYLLPRDLLEREGVYDKLKRSYNAGDANMVVNAVENGEVDAGAAYESVFQVVYKNTPAKTKNMRVIGFTEYIPNGIYVARPDMSNQDVEKLKKAFMDMNTDPEGIRVMKLAPNDKIVPADDKLFDYVRETATRLHIDVKRFDKKK